MLLSKIISNIFHLNGFQFILKQSDLIELYGCFDGIEMLVVLLIVNGGQ